MSTITEAARSAIKLAVASACLVSLAGNAAAQAVAPPPPPPKPVVKHIPYQAPGQTDLTSAYGFRTRILTGTPGCQRFATDADNVFIDDKADEATKVARLQRIGADAGAAGCLAP